MHLKEISAWKKRLLQQSVTLFDQKHKEDGERERLKKVLFKYLLAQLGVSLFFKNEDSVSYRKRSTASIVS